MSSYLSRENADTTEEFKCGSDDHTNIKTLISAKDLFS